LGFLLLLVKLWERFSIWTPGLLLSAALGEGGGWLQGRVCLPHFVFAGWSHVPVPGVTSLLHARRTAVLSVTLDTLGIYLCASAGTSPAAGWPKMAETRCGHTDPVSIPNL